MNSPLKVLGTLALLVVIGAVVAFAWPKGAAAPQLPITATTTVPSAPNPATTTPTKPTPAPAQKDTAALNQRIYNNGVYITPLEVLADSRCPMGVYCIQAGEIKIRAKLEDANHTETVIMYQGSPVAFGDKHVTLMSAIPPKPQSITINPADYRFTFSVAFGMGSEGPSNCCGE